MRKNVLLTLWLVLPFVVVAVIFAWVFTSFRSGRDEKYAPIGAGAGDAGGANAIGQWLEGEHPRPLADPHTWPGGIELLAPVDAAPWLADPDADPRVIAVHEDPGEKTPRTWVMHRRENEFIARIRSDELVGVEALLVSPTNEVRVVSAGGRATATEPAGRPVLVAPLDPVDPGELLHADALPIHAEPSR